jgi:cobaltochelatase CobS
MSIKTQATATAETLSEVDEINADCEVVNEMASDLFPEVYGNNSQILGFEVPKLDFGVGHPDVPEPDSSFRFYTAVLAEALHAIAENEIIWLHGHSGCGKSEFWPQVAARLNMPFTRVNLDGHLTRSDIVGGMKLVSDGKGGSETRFIEGALPRAMSRPGILLLDEFDCGDPEIMPIFQPVLEGKPIVLLEDGGRIVYPHPMFRIAITGNSTGLGSESQMYLNVHEQSAATRDRISAFVEMPYMPAKIEKEVIMARMPDADEDFVEKLIGLANKVREGFAKDEIFTLFSTRAVQYCARRHIRFAPLYATPEEASHEVLKTVILNRLDPASHSKVKELVDAMFI